MEQNEIGAFAERLVQINGIMAELFKKGNVALFSELNKAIAALYRIQHGSANPVLKALDQECAVIYKNFDMIVAVLRTTEEGVIDEGAQKALNRLLHNIDTAVIDIAKALELV